MSLQNITLLGSTGSIGVSTLDVIRRHPERYRAFALCAHSQIDKLFEQCMEFRPRHAVLRDAALADQLRARCRAAGLDTAVHHGVGRAALKTWVFGILRHKIVDLIRRAERTTPFSTLSDDEEELENRLDALFRANGHWLAAGRPRDWGDPAETAQDRAFWTVFEICLDHLPENTARVFMMREFLELETDEICHQLAISAGNCGVILYRARSGLRRCLQNGWLAGEDGK